MAELPRSRRNGSPTSAVEILDVLRAQRLLWSTEDELQRGLAAALEGAGLTWSARFG
jgi:hypothetical protein